MTCSFLWKIINMQSKREGKDQNSKQSSTTSDPGYQWENDNSTNESREVSPFPAVEHKASINRRARQHNINKTEMIHKKARPWHV